MIAHVGISTIAFAIVENYFGTSSVNLIFASILIFISHMTVDVIRQEILIKFKITLPMSCGTIFTLPIELSNDVSIFALKDLSFALRP